MASRETLDGLEVLLAEEDADYRDALERLLRQCGARVTAAATWREAARLARRDAYDLVVAGVAMPSRGGMERIAMLRKASPHARIVAVSGDVPGAASDGIARLGVDGLVFKPFTVERLLAVFRDVMEGAVRDRAQATSPAEGKERT